MRAIASAFSCSREIPIQETVTLVSSEWLNKAYPKTIFVDSSVPSKRYRMCKSKDLLISKLDPNIFEGPHSGISNAKYVDVDRTEFCNFPAIVQVILIAPMTLIQ